MRLQIGRVGRSFAGVIARSAVCDEAIPNAVYHCERLPAPRPGRGCEAIPNIEWGPNKDTPVGKHTYYIYIMTNKHNTVLYTGVTNDLERRPVEHKIRLHAGFTSRYNISKVVYYKVFGDIDAAILREKQIKAGSRQKKTDLVNGMNPSWKDLSEEWLQT